MMYEIFKFELQYRARRYDTYLYFVVLFLFSIVSVDFIFEGELEPLSHNSPLIIARTMGIVTALFMMIISMIMGTSVLRDFDYNMESLMFVNPFKKRDYLLGRFAGSFVVLVLIFSGLFLGMIVGNFMPWHEADQLLPFHFWYYLQPFLFLVLPTLFFGGALFFITGALSRKLLVVYTQGFFFLLIYLVAINLAKGSNGLFLTGLLEPFTFQTLRIVTKAWSVVDRNTLMVPMQGVLLYNRLLWTILGVLTLSIGSRFFRFEVVRSTSRNKRPNISPKSSVVDSFEAIPFGNSSTNLGFFTGLKQLVHLTVFNVRFIVREVSFWAIVLCGIGILFINSFNLGTTFGVDNYPTTYLIVGELVELTAIFFLGIIFFYSGELIWKERDTKIDGLTDVLPISGFIQLTGKFLGLAFILILLMVTMIGAGILFQTAHGYFEYEIPVYLAGFFLEVLPFLLLLSLLCFFFQVIINHKFLAYFAVFIFIACTTIGFNKLGWSHGLISLGGSNLHTYSDMNGYGHFLAPYVWIKLYWLAFCFLLFSMAGTLTVRGTEHRFFHRIKQSRHQFTGFHKLTGAITLFVFVASGAFVFYNTNILNEYASPKTQQAYRAEYERLLKPFQQLPQPEITAVTLALDLFPTKRAYSVVGQYTLINPHKKALTELHIQKTPSSHVELTRLSLKSVAVIDSTFSKFGYYKLYLPQPLQPGDSLTLNFAQTFTSNGFTESSQTSMVYNGTLLETHHFPTIGYLPDIELEETDLRAEFGLTPMRRSAAINDERALQDGKANFDGEEIHFELLVSTDSAQTAVAPGELLETWVNQSRRYFHYKTTRPISNFYSIVSGNYELLEDEWLPANDADALPVTLEIYYQKGHEFNLNRMMVGMKSALNYYSANFSPYQFQQLRIAETPTYSGRAQSLPGIITFSESIGFIMDVENETDPDMPFFITAHEVAHQWWGDQINPANVQGKTMISETLAQYSALMVAKHTSTQAQLSQLLRWNMGQYLKNRSREKTREMPLSLVESGQDYIYYRKGLLAFHTLQHALSEETINNALRQFITDWNSWDGPKKMASDRYPTTNDLLGYLREATPDSLQYLVRDVFESVIVYENKITRADFAPGTNNQYEVTVVLETNKFSMDSLGTEQQIPLNEWIEVGFYTTNAAGNEQLLELRKVHITKNQTEVRFEMAQQPVKVTLDPNLLLIDKDLENNEKKFEDGAHF